MPESSGTLSRRHDKSDTEVVHRKHPGRWLSGAILLVLAALIVKAFYEGHISWESVGGYLFSPIFIQAAGNTVILAIVAQAVAIVVGTGIALLRRSASPVNKVFAGFYIWFFRGVPVLVQIMIFYNLALVFPRLEVALPGMAPLIDVSMNKVLSPFTAALLGLSLNESAYMAEIVRGGIKSVDSGQIEAAKALGMAPSRVMRRIVLPQAMRVIIPPTGNDFINMLKSTSLAAVITYPELLRAAQNLSSANLEVMEALLATVFWYLAIVTITSIAQSYVEAHFESSAKTKELPRINWKKIWQPPRLR